MRARPSVRRTLHFRRPESDTLVHSDPNQWLSSLYDSPAASALINVEPHPSSLYSFGSSDADHFIFGLGDGFPGAMDLSCDEFSASTPPPEDGYVS
jgi:hypothetical protein